MRALVIISALLCFSATAQESIKLEQQQTTFFYTQLNLHGGFVNDVNGQGWDFSPRAPHNQLTFQVFNKSQRRMQKGYIKLISYEASRVRTSVTYDQYIDGFGQENMKFEFKLRDTWVRFGTKWDRTKIWIGNKGIPYGHNPKIDPTVSFSTNIVKMDLGFAQDLGIFIRTPISQFIDLELSVTSGGLLNRPLVVCDNILDHSVQKNTNPEVRFSNYPYANTWLIMSRIGTPTFRRAELGAMLLTGRISNTFIPNDHVNMFRVGADWVYKHNESFKFSSLLTAGMSESDTEGEFATINLQAALDVFLAGRFVLTGAYALNHAQQIDDVTYHTNRNFLGSFGYTFNPHTRLRINVYDTKVLELDEHQWGVLLQFVTGFGKRP